MARQALGDAEAVPQRQFSEGTLICGRRSGKSDRLAANVAVFEAATGGHEKSLTIGERGHIVLIAQDKRAARVLYQYILAKLENSLLLSQLIQDVRKEEIDLTNNLTISIFPCSFRATRGFSIPVAILDEVAFFRVEGEVTPFTASQMSRTLRADSLPENHLHGPPIRTADSQLALDRLPGCVDQVQFRGRS